MDADVTTSGTRAPAPSHDFYDSLPPFASFASITRPEHYRPLPADWVIGIADVVASSQAIAAGHYRAVNTVGAAVIAAVTNALPDLAFPFAFGGDGASLAAPVAHAGMLRDALARTAAWSEDALQLRLRTAVIPIAAVRAAGFDVNVARYDVGQDITYAMFSGGGMAWAEERLKEGAFQLPRASPGKLPDLSGLVCGFATIGAQRGTILSVIVVPKDDEAAFAGLVDDVVALIEAENADGPVPHRLAEPAFEGTPLSEAIKDVRATALPAGLASAEVSAIPLPKEAAAIMHDTDFRKFGDGLRMTIDCEPAVADAIERLLGQAQAAGLCHFGAHRQDAANLTCLLPSTRVRQAHFIDGADGGYATAAARLKAAKASH